MSLIHRIDRFVFLAPILTKPLLSVFLSHRAWLLMDAVFNIMLGLLLIAQPFNVTSPLTSLAGCYIVSLSTYSLAMFKRERDFYIQPYHIYIYSRLVASVGVVFIVSTVAGHDKYAQLATLLVVGDMACQNNYVDRPTWTNRLLRLDGFISLVQALAYLSLPSMHVMLLLGGRPSDPQSLPLIKLSGCLLLGRSFQSSTGSCLLFEKDKQKLIMSNLFASSLELATIFMSAHRFQEATKQWWISALVALKLTFHLLSALVSYSLLSQLKKQAADETKEK
ncbi:hypothetical protein ACOME3_005997 [Neoechinorhynchus agilis]